MIVYDDAQEYKDETDEAEEVGEEKVLYVPIAMKPTAPHD